MVASGVQAYVHQTAYILVNTPLLPERYSSQFSFSIVTCLNGNTEAGIDFCSLLNILMP